MDSVRTLVSLLLFLLYALSSKYHGNCSTFRNMVTKVTHDHCETERPWRPHAKSAYNSALEIEIPNSVLRSCSSSTAQPCSSLGPEHTLAHPVELCFSLGLEHKCRRQLWNSKRRSERRTENHASGFGISNILKIDTKSQRRANVNGHEAFDA